MPSCRAARGQVGCFNSFNAPVWETAVNCWCCIVPGQSEMDGGSEAWTTHPWVQGISDPPAHFVSESTCSRLCAPWSCFASKPTTGVTSVISSRCLPPQLWCYSLVADIRAQITACRTNKALNTLLDFAVQAVQSYEDVCWVSTLCSGPCVPVSHSSVLPCVVAALQRLNVVTALRLLRRMCGLGIYWRLKLKLTCLIQLCPFFTQASAFAESISTD